MSISGSKNDPLEERADALVEMAKLIASEAYMDAIGEFSFMKSVRDGEGGIEHFHFIATIAGVFVAMTRLKNIQLGIHRERLLTERVYRKFNEWNPENGLLGYEHCKSFFERTYDALLADGTEPRFVSSDPIGMWIAWDILDRAPSSEEEQRFVRNIGVFVTHAFYGWWDERAQSV